MSEVTYAKWCGKPSQRFPVDTEKPYRAESAIECGYVLVDPEGRESVLGYASKVQAEFAAEILCDEYRRWKLSDLLAENKRLRDACQIAAQQIRAAMTGGRLMKRETVLKALEAFSPTTEAKETR